MVLRRSLIVLLLLGTCFYFSYGQAVTEWRNYVDSGGDVWFQAPASAFVSQNRESDPGVVALYTFFDGVKLTVTQMDVKGDGLKYVKQFKLPWEKGGTVQNLKSENFYVRRVDELVGPDVFVKLYVGSKKQYFLFDLAASKDNPALQRFLNTVRFGGARLYPGPAVHDIDVNLAPVAFDKLPTSPEVEAALKKKPASPEPVAKFQTIKQKLPLDLDKLSRDVTVVLKPRPGYTDNARMNGIQGTIYANVQYLASGEIGNIIVDDRLDRGLANMVVEAVRKIKFIPAEIDGKPVDVTQTLHYSFSIY